MHDGRLKEDTNMMKLPRPLSTNFEPSGTDIPIWVSLSNLWRYQVSQQRHHLASTVRELANIYQEAANLLYSKWGQALVFGIISVLIWSLISMVCASVKMVEKPELMTVFGGFFIW